jgi:hypothetical protein
MPHLAARAAGAGVTVESLSENRESVHFSVFMSPREIGQFGAWPPDPFMAPKPHAAAAAGIAHFGLSLVRCPRIETLDAAQR